MRDQAQLKATVEVHDTQLKALEDAAILLDMADEAKDEATAAEAEGLIEAAEAAIGKLEFARMLSGPYDRSGAILSINAGAGGTESQDWAQMLLRMYSRWAQR
jgi:peptide chain release factor 2